MIQRRYSGVSNHSLSGPDASLAEEETAAWIEDLSEVYQVLFRIPDQGSENIRQFFNEFPEELIRCRNLIRITDANQTCLNLFGYDSIKALDQNRFHIFPLETLISLRELLITLSEGKTQFEADIIAQSKDGTQIPIRFHLTVLPGYQKTLERVLCSCFLDTAGTLDQQPENTPYQTLKEFIRDLSVPVFIINQDYKIQCVNPILTRILGNTGEEYIGEDGGSMFPETYRETVCEILKRSTTGTQIQGSPLPLLQQTGDQRIIIWNFIPIPEISGDGFFVVAQGVDITEQHWAKEYMNRYISELMEKNAELETSRSKLKEINETLDEKVKIRAKAMEDLLRQKEEFINRIGHDLRTPLTPLMAILPVLLKKEQDNQKQQYLEMAIRNTSHAHDILISIIQMARMNTAYLPDVVTDLPIRQMIEEIIVNFEAVILKRRVEIHNLVPEDLRVSMTPLDFDTIFENLIDNAIRYTKPTGFITIDGKEGEGRIIIRCIDNGVGILPEERRYVFDPFYKADTSRHDGKSYGLGLSITKKLIERNGGTITVTSEGRDKGACFTIVIPSRTRGET